MVNLANVFAFYYVPWSATLYCLVNWKVSSLADNIHDKNGATPHLEYRHVVSFVYVTLFNKRFSVIKDKSKDKVSTCDVIALMLKMV